MTEGWDGLPKRDACPDPELIAAHAERRLVGDEAARMDAHLVSCPTCPELFAEAVRFVEEEELEPAPARAVAPVRGVPALQGVQRPSIHHSRSGYRLAAALAAAAAVIFAFQLWRRGPGPAERSSVAGPANGYARPFRSSSTDPEIGRAGGAHSDPPRAREPGGPLCLTRSNRRLREPAGWAGRQRD